MDFDKTAWLALGLCSGFATGCGSDDVDAKTAQAAMRELVSSVDATVIGYQSHGGGTGVVNLECAAGGTADVTGHVDVATDPVSVDVKLAIAYAACQTQSGTTLNGNLDFTQSVVAGKVPLRVQTAYKGDVALSGKVEASCPVDVSVLVDEAGEIVQVSGEVCGNEAASLDLTITPRWTR